MQTLLLAQVFDSLIKTNNVIGIVASNNIIRDYGAEGYGLYIILLSDLAESKEKYLVIDDNFLKRYSDKCKVDEKTIKSFINDCIKKYDVLKYKNGTLYSEHINNALNRIENVFNVNKRKIYYEGIDILRDEHKWSVFLKELIQDNEFKGLSSLTIIKQRNEALDWLSSKGRKYKNYKAFFKNWLRNNIKRNPPKTNKMVY